MVTVPTTLNYIVSKDVRLAYDLIIAILFESHQPDFVCLTSKYREHSQTFLDSWSFIAKRYQEPNYLLLLRKPRGVKQLI